MPVRLQPLGFIGICGNAIPHNGHVDTGGIDGMSEVQRPDEVGTVLRFLAHFLRVEVHHLRRHH